MEKLEKKDEASQEAVFHKGRKWMIPRSCFIVLTLGKTYSAEEIGEEKKKINLWSQRGDRYVVDFLVSQTSGPPPELLILNETLLEERDKRKLKKAFELPEN